MEKGAESLIIIRLDQVREGRDTMQRFPTENLADLLQRLSVLNLSWLMNDEGES